MYVSVLHNVKDPASFQTRGRQVQEAVPADFTPLQFVPDTEGRLASCIWEGSSVDAVRDHIDGCLGDSSDQQYFVVAEQYAFGLPVTQSS